MGEPVRKASGRTFQPMSTLVSDTCWSSHQVQSFDSLKTSNQPLSETLKSGLPMAMFATVKFTFGFILNFSAWASGDSSRYGCYFLSPDFESGSRLNINISLIFISDAVPWLLIPKVTKFGPILASATRSRQAARNVS